VSDAHQIAIGEVGAAVHVGQVVIQHADGCTTHPVRRGYFSAALVELADWAEDVPGDLA
jgi:hypothetical protein